jgi:TRAP-type C4-dicarboxylate transport system permease small subunit
VLVYAGGISYDSRVSGGDSPAGASPEPAVARGLTWIDRGVAKVEEGVLLVALVALILAGAYQAIATNLLSRGDAWPFEVIRYCVFTIAMFGGAYASQRGQQIGIDVLTRLLPARPKALAHIVIALFVVGICAVLFVEGLDVREQSLAGGDHFEVIPPSIGLLAFPAGVALIGLHFLVQAVVKASYLAAGLEPPARDATPVH